MSEEAQSQGNESAKSPGSLLADNMYGEPEKPAPETPAPEEPEQPEGEYAKPEGEEAPEGGEQPEGEEGKGEEGEEEVQVATLSDLAEHMSESGYDVDADWFKQLKTVEKINGKEVEIPLEEAISNYRQQKAGEQILSESKEKAKSIYEEANQAKEQANAQFHAVGELLKTIEQDIEQEANSAELRKLREDDPAEYSAKHEEIRQRREKLDQLKQDAVNKYHEMAQGQTEQQKQEREKALPKEQEVFLERVPEWKDEEKKNAERQELLKFLSDEGFSEQDIQSVAYNGKALSYLVYAMRYAKGKQKAGDIKKKMVTVPKKTMKPGTSKEKPKPNGADKDDPVSILYG